ncbi:uncharacterized protein M437DRAFT_59126 [Aureobasidium melanogenum CBS 110374]|uniref:Uncharacterized protein n=1 Tax=Aureobasidium melanogenum (strain CBS 110374) TaxID=1043003 RepID=A0A074W7H5_AURM1|nr:uncharacterized protein M437DRAFT_59126 [Aureobasidium melanogenum CBS 110374]KEQ58521.1 hypothetical protein M437DRAFT_59126 [Aureobasidium melanogenum CBS 110374]
MDSFVHSCHKIMLERASAEEDSERHPQELSDIPPPAYCAEESLTDLEDEEEDEDPSPVTLILNADTKVQGTGNMIATPPLADAARLSTLLLAAVQSLNAAKTSASESGSPTPVLQVNLTINCGITVVGDKNVIGYKTQAVLPTTSKRKMTEEV